MLHVDMYIYMSIYIYIYTCQGSSVYIHTCRGHGMPLLKFGFSVDPPKEDFRHAHSDSCASSPSVLPMLNPIA